MKTEITLEFWRTLSVVLFVMLLSLMSSYAKADNVFSSDAEFSAMMEKSMQVVEQKMMATEDCFEAINTRNELLCTIWERNIATPNFGKY